MRPSYLAKRVSQAVFTVFIVVSLSFGMIRLIPGGPLDYLQSQMIQQGMDPTQAREFASTYVNVEPDKPLHLQYLDYMSSVFLELDFGKSIIFSEPVSDIVFRALPWTMFVMTMAISLGFFLGIALGGVMALYEGGRFDIGATLSTLLANSVPYYIVALLSLLLFSYNLGWFPTSGRYPGGVEVGINVAFISGVFYHATLPVASLVVTSVGGTAISMRANSIKIIGTDYLRVARLRGIAPSRLAMRYVTYNAVLPLYTSLMISLGAMFGGSVILEQIFRYQGLGYYFFTAISARDYPLLMGSFILTTSAIVVGIMIADFTYGMIDPRISVAGDGHE